MTKENCVSPRRSLEMDGFHRHRNGSLLCNASVNTAGAAFRNCLADLSSRRASNAMGLSCFAQLYYQKENNDVM